MRRILVVGSPGSGKSTLARRLAAKLKLPLVHLDFHFWRVGWEPADEPTFRNKVRELAAGPEWVMDGNYSRTFDVRMPRADTLVWLEYPRSTCFLRALGRALRNYGRVRPDLPPGCPEKIDVAFLRYIWDFPVKHRPRIPEGIQLYGRHLRVVHLHSDRAGDDLIAAAEAC
jgi:adenylate kinase family enzyme